MSCKIIIPSHKRPDRVISKRLVENPILCVPESQAAEYREHNPELEIVTHPDSVVGLPPKRNWMADHFGALFMVDDDLMKFTVNVTEHDETPEEYTPAQVNNVIYATHELAELMGIRLYGFGKLTHPAQYVEHSPLVLSRSVSPPYGITNPENLYWNENLKLKEDYWISSLVKHLYRMTLIDLRYTFQAKATFKNPGGLSEFRNLKVERETSLMLRKHFGESIRIKLQRSSVKTLRYGEFHIQAIYPF